MKRKNIFRTNKYQRQALIVPLISNFVLATGTSLLIFYLKNYILSIIKQATDLPFLELINQWTVLLIIIVWIFFLCVILWALTTSNHLVGAFERIIRELDEILEGKRRGPILARKSDQLANDLLKRINFLIKK